MARLKTILIFSTLTLLIALIGFQSVRFAKNNTHFVQPSGCIIEVENQSGVPLGAVRLLELGKLSELGPLAPGEKKRVSHDGRQSKKPVSLAFGRTHKSARQAGRRAGVSTTRTTLAKVFSN